MKVRLPGFISCCIIWLACAAQINGQTLDLNGLPTGAYQVRVASGQGVATRKVVLE